MATVSIISLFPIYSPTLRLTKALDDIVALVYLQLNSQKHTDSSSTRKCQLLAQCLLYKT